MPKSYIFSNKDLIWTKKRKILTSHTLYFNHEFNAPNHKNLLKKLYFFISCLLKWLNFYRHLLRAKYINGRVAVIYWGENIFHFNAEHNGNLFQILDSKLHIDYFILPQDTSFQRFFVEKLNIPQDKILSPKPNRLLHIKELVVPTLYPMWEAVDYRDKTSWAKSFPLTPYIYNAYNFLVPKITPKRKIFLKRPKNSNRNIENSIEVEKIFADFGYEIILPDLLSFDKQITMFNNAKIVASMHSAGLANVLFMQKGACVFEIYPSFYHDGGPRILSIGRGLKYFYMVTESRLGESTKRQCDNLHHLAKNGVR
ncbi:glycosyltransferase family 61 protein [Helicobacter sp. 23-1044]